MEAIQRFKETYSFLFKKYCKLLISILTLWMLSSVAALMIIVFIVALFPIFGFFAYLFLFISSCVCLLVSIDLVINGKADESWSELSHSGINSNFFLILEYIIVCILILFMTVFYLLFFDQIPHDTWQWLRLLRLSNADCSAKAAINAAKQPAGDWGARALPIENRSMGTAILGGLMRPL